MKRKLANMPISQLANEKPKFQVIPYMLLLKNAFTKLKSCKVGKLKGWLTRTFIQLPYILIAKNTLVLRSFEQRKSTKNVATRSNFTTLQLSNFIPYMPIVKNALRLCTFACFAGNKSAMRSNFPIFQFSNFPISKYLLICSFTHLLISCSSNNYTPKPTGYPRIDLPKKEYTDFDSPECGFSFRVPKYAVVQLDKERGAEACWYNIVFPQFNAKIHLSYKPVSSFKNFYEMSEDAHTFAYKHTVKAEDIYDSAFYFKDNHTSGFLFSIEGNTASAIQFYATDSSKHYLRGALYFNAQPNKDSLQPVVNFIRADVDTLLKSLRWK